MLTLYYSTRNGWVIYASVLWEDDEFVPSHFRSNRRDNNSVELPPYDSLVATYGISRPLGLLVLNFEMRFSMLYQRKVTDASWCTLKDALLLPLQPHRFQFNSMHYYRLSFCSSQSDSKGYYSALKLWKKAQSKRPSKAFLRASEKNAKDFVAGATMHPWECTKKHRLLSFDRA